MPKILPLTLCLFAFAACATVADDEEADCTIAGTYSLTGERESGNCPTGDGDEGATAITISPAPPSSAADYSLQIAGVEGRCPLTKLSACKLQGKCDLAVPSPLDPANAIGSIQYTWTFSRSGLSGFSALSLPPTKTLPEGCSATEKSTGTLR